MKNQAKSILNTMFDGNGTKIEVSSNLDVYNQNAEKVPLSGSASLDISLKTNESKDYEVVVNLFTSNPEEHNHKSVRLTIKKSFAEALTALIFELDDSIKVEKIM